MLKAFLGTLILFFILLIYFLPQQKDASYSTTEDHSQSPKKSEISGLNLPDGSVQMQSDPLSITSKSKPQAGRKISSEELMEDFYKDGNNEKIKRAKEESAFLSKYLRVASDYYIKTQEEKWSAFRDVYVTMDKTEESLLSFGPYKITDKPAADMPRAQLIYNENQKTFAIITGRLIAKLKNLFDEERISKDYGFKIDSVNPDIKTVFYKLDEQSNISDVRKTLRRDSRIDSFYFETVHNQWQKN